MFDFATEVAIASEDTKQYTAVGSVAGQRVTVTGKRNGKPVMRFRSNWLVTTNLERAGMCSRKDGWWVNVYGDTSIQLDISFPMRDEERKATLPNLTAHWPSTPSPTFAAPALGN